MPRQPDKTLFAGLTLVLAGLLTAALACLQLLAASIQPLPGVAEDLPPVYSLVTGLITLAFGAAAVARQSPVWVAFGAAAAILSLGFYLVAPLLGLVAVALAVFGWRGRAAPRLPADAWPDKAVAASMVLFVAGMLALIHAVYILIGRLEFPVPAPIAVPLAVATGGYMLWASRQAFQVRRAPALRVAAAAAVMSLSFYVAGPLLGIVTLLLLGMADREHEFSAAAA